MSPLERLARWMLDPRYREEVLGDLIELRERRRLRSGPRRAARRYVWDLASSCLLLTRARRDPRGSALSLALTLLLLGVLVTRGAATPDTPGRYTVNAVDPVGRFSLEIEGTRVVAASMNGSPVPLGAIRQRDLRVVIAGGPGGREFEVRVKPEGGIEWTARSLDPASSPR